MPTKAQLQEQLKRERELADSKYKNLEVSHNLYICINDDLKKDINNLKKELDNCKRNEGVYERRWLEVASKHEGLLQAFRIVTGKENNGF